MVKPLSRSVSDPEAAYVTRIKNQQRRLPLQIQQCRKKLLRLKERARAIGMADLFHDQAEIQ